QIPQRGERYKDKSDQDLMIDRRKDLGVRRRNAVPVKSFGEGCDKSATLCLVDELIRPSVRLIGIMRFSALMLLALMVSLSCQWNESAGSDAKLRTQVKADVPRDTRGDLHDRASLTTGTTSLRFTETGFTEADFERHVKELNVELK